MKNTFHEHLLKLETKLRDKQGDNYQGFVSLVDELANTYINTCHYSRENEYFGYKRYLSLSTHLLGWLLQNYRQYKRPFNIKRTMAVIDGQLRKEKVKIFHKWVGNQLIGEQKVLESKKIDEIKFEDIKENKLFYTKMYYNLIKTVNSHSGKKMKTVKEELGL